MVINRKKKIMRTICILAGASMLSGCGGMLDMPVGVTGESRQEASVSKEHGQYEITNYDYDTSENDAMEINLEQLSETENDAYTYDGRQLVIHAAGDYRITGKLKGGKLIVCVCEDEIVHLILDGVEIEAPDGAALFIEKAAKVVLTLKEGTENVLCDGPAHAEGEKACIFSNTDLTINGDGFLSVYGHYADAVRSKDKIRIVNTGLYVKAKGDGVRGNDGVLIIDSAVEAECEGTGILSESDKDMVVVKGGNCKVIAGENAVSARQYVSISGCQTDLYSVLETIRCDGIVEIEEE